MKPENLQQDFGINNFKIYKIMKNWNWKQWTAIGITVTIIVAAIICHLVQPTITYAWLEIVSVSTFSLGAVTGYLFNKKYN